MNRWHCLLAVSVGLVAGFFATLTAGPSPTSPLVEGELNGARFAIARPIGPWNGHLLLHAHGYRSESAPLVADLFPGHAAYAKLLDEGWMIAMTSYRRNGLIITDALDDLDRLREHVASAFGEPTRVILEGDSMGGAIVTLLAERGDGTYTGAIAVGAALQVREPNGTTGVNFRPKVPLLFLTNQSELEGPRAYVQQATTLATLERDLVAPVVFRVSRDGHVNVNQAERLLAVRALMGWIEVGRASLPGTAPRAGDSPAAEFFDATVVPRPLPSKVTPTADGRGFVATIQEVSAIYGNAYVDAQPADFAAAGIQPGTFFRLSVGEQVFRVRYGRDFDSVERGQWVMFPNAEGFFWLARNLENAARTAGLSVGGGVVIERYPSR